MEELACHVPLDQELLATITQTFILVSVLVAIWFTHRCSSQNRTKGWRLLGVSVWLVFGLLVALAEYVILVVGCPPLPVLDILLWLDRTVLVVGYLIIGLTSRELTKLYANKRKQQ